VFEKKKKKKRESLFKLLCLVMAYAHTTQHGQCKLLAAYLVDGLVLFQYLLLLLFFSSYGKRRW
jgi:hypothetical protein